MYRSVLFALAKPNQKANKTKSIIIIIVILFFLLYIFNDLKSVLIVICNCHNTYSLFNIIRFYDFIHYYHKCLPLQCYSTMFLLIWLDGQAVLFFTHSLMPLFHTCLIYWYRWRYCRQDLTAQLVRTFTLSQLKYSHSCLAGLLHLTIFPLQRVQNSGACLIMNLGPRDQVT